MTTEYVDRHLGIRVFMPEGWHVGRIGENWVVVAPPEFSELEPRFMPASVSIRQIGLPSGDDDGAFVENLMRRRIGQGRVEVCETGRPNWTTSEWTDGVMFLISYFLRRSDSLVEVTYGVDPRNAHLTLTDIQRAVEIKEI
jgi:hypothetical protein